MSSGGTLSLLPPSCRVNALGHLFVVNLAALGGRSAVSPFGVIPISAAEKTLCVPFCELTRAFLVSSPASFCFVVIDLLIFREGGREEGGGERNGGRLREQNIGVLFHLLVCPLVDTCTCPERGSNPQPPHVRTMLRPTKLPGQGCLSASHDVDVQESPDHLLRRALQFRFVWFIYSRLDPGLMFFVRVLCRCRRVLLGESLQGL